MRPKHQRLLYVAAWSVLLSLLASCATAVTCGHPRAGGKKAPPFLWEIAGPTPSYLFGTMHVSDPRVSTLAPSVKCALTQSQVVYLETRGSDIVPRDLMRATLRKDKRAMMTILGRELYEKVKAYFARYKLPPRAFESLKVWMLTVQLSLFDYAKYRRGLVMDQMIENHALATGKRVRSLETPLVGFQLLDTLTVAEQVSLLRLSLNQLARARKTGRNLAEQMIVHYARGDAKRLVELLNLDKADVHPVMKKFVDLLLTRRNLYWLKTILPALRAKPSRTSFFAVGAGHTLGSQGLVALLRARGFKVRRLGYR